MNAAFDCSGLAAHSPFWSNEVDILLRFSVNSPLHQSSGRHLVPAWHGLRVRNPFPYFSFSGLRGVLIREPSRMLIGGEKKVQRQGMFTVNGSSLRPSIGQSERLVGGCRHRVNCVLCDAGFQQSSRALIRDRTSSSAKRLDWIEIRGTDCRVHSKHNADANGDAECQED